MISVLCVREVGGCLFFYVRTMSARQGKREREKFRIYIFAIGPSRILHKDIIYI